MAGQLLSTYRLQLLVLTRFLLLALLKDTAGQDKIASGDARPSTNAFHAVGGFNAAAGSQHWVPVAVLAQV